MRDASSWVIWFGIVMLVFGEFGSILGALSGWEMRVWKGVKEMSCTGSCLYTLPQRCDLEPLPCAQLGYSSIGMSVTTS